MSNVIDLVGLIVVILAILSLSGFGELHTHRTPAMRRTR